MSVGRISAATLDAIRAGDITKVLSWYPVKSKKKAWSCPLHDDEHPSASVKHNRLHCFVCDRTVDGIGLIMALEGRSFPDAAAKAAVIHGIPLKTDIPAESARYAAALHAARPEGEELFRWREELLVYLRDQRNAKMELYQKAKGYIVRNGMNDRRADVVADIADRYETEYLALDEQIAAVASAPWMNLLSIYRREKGAAA